MRNLRGREENAQWHYYLNSLCDSVSLKQSDKCGGLFRPQEKLTKMSISISSYQCFCGLPVENCFLVSQTAFNFTCQIVQKERPDIQTREVTFMSRLWCKRNPDNEIT